jgi:AcrR family transcriptional regulator
MENNVLSSARRDQTPSTGAGAVDQAIDRSLEGRREAARQEIERLVSAAFRVIERTGHLEPKVSEILAEAGLSNQAFYRHFAGKHALLVALLDEGIRGLADYLAARMAEAPDPITAIRAWIRGMAAQALDPSGARASRPFALARGRLAEAFPSEIAESEHRVTAPLRDALEQARASQTLPAVVPEADAESLYHLMMGWVEARLIEGRIPDAHEVERLESFALAGLQGVSTTPDQDERPIAEREQDAHTNDRRAG